MTLPPAIRDGVRDRLWDEADSVGWTRLSGPDKSRKYDDWVVREDVGGVLARHMDARQVRVYLKDSVMKTYALSRMRSDERPFRCLGIAQSEPVVQDYTKPHGRRLGDGRVVCWGPASNWKAVLVAVYERAYTAAGTEYAAVLTGAQGRFHSEAVRAKVEEAARRLRIERVLWLED